MEDADEGICYTELSRFHHEPDWKALFPRAACQNAGLALLYGTRRYDGLATIFCIPEYGKPRSLACNYKWEIFNHQNSEELKFHFLALHFKF